MKKETRAVLVRLVLETKFIKDPFPVWDEIKIYLSDDGGELIQSGTFIGVFENEMAGAFLVKPWTDYCYEVHGGVAKKYWGRGPEICKAMGVFLFQKTPCLKIVAIIPEFNQLMRLTVRKIGMKQEGIITKSFMKRFRMWDQYVYGITKGEYKWLQRQ